MISLVNSKQLTNSAPILSKGFSLPHRKLNPLPQSGTKTVHIVNENIAVSEITKNFSNMTANNFLVFLILDDLTVIDTILAEKLQH